jgi:hypothetical protein
MLRREWRQASRRLLELSLAADTVPAACLIPGDRNMDESLEEVLLRRLSRAPNVLERLVRLEVLAVLDLREPLCKPILHGWSVTLESGVATILLTGVDLFFRGKLEASLPSHHFVTPDSVDPPDLVIADIARVDPDEVADAFPETPILGFTNHSDTTGLRHAHEAGFDQVVAKSALVERAPQLVDELIA